MPESGFDHHNVIITGIPRSGTTLTCHLLNQVPDIIALHEPIPFPMSHRAASRNELCFRIGHFFCESRRSLKHFNTAMSHQCNGQIPDNPKGGYPGNRSKLLSRFVPFKKNRLGLRKSITTMGPVYFEKKLSHDFLLCINHNAGFTVLLDNLINYFPCFALVRNPLSVLASWNSIDFPPRKGHSPAAERVDTGLGETLSSIPDRYERQIRFLSWFFERYESALAREQIIYYEDIIVSRGKALAKIRPAAGGIDQELKSMNLNKLYDKELMLMLGEKLLKRDGAFWQFYTRASVEAVLNEIE